MWSQPYMQRFGTTGGYNTTGTATPAQKTPNPWVREMQGVLKGFGFDPGSLASLFGQQKDRSMDPTALGYLNASVSGGPVGTGFVDPAAAIKAALPGIYEQQTKAFGDSAARFGRTGMLASSPYMEALGGVSRKSTNDIASLTENMLYQAYESMANRQLQADIANRNRQLQAAQLAQNAAQAGWADNGNANALSSLMSQVGDWYMRMREGDEGRSMSQWSMQQPWLGGY